MSNYCSKTGIGCEFANSNGYCSVTGCRKSLTWNIGNEHCLFKLEPERTVNLMEAIDAICSEMCGDGWDWYNRAETVVKTVAKMCGAKVVDK